MWHDERSANLVLADTEIHIWQASLAVSSDTLQHFAQTLSDDEQKRADRFRFPRDSHRFVAGRGILRGLLGCYLQMPPEEIQFCYSDRGKPSLASPSATAGLEFNLSHSDDLMVCAIARGCSVGIDLEHLRPVENLEGLTQRFFAPQEHAAIHALPEESQLRAFFQHWTCKEALLKATGDGLTNLNAIEVSIEGNMARLVSGQGATQLADRWSLQLFTPAAGYIAAVATDSPDRSITFWQ